MCPLTLTGFLKDVAKLHRGAKLHSIALPLDPIEVPIEIPVRVPLDPNGVLKGCSAPMG